MTFRNDLSQFHIKQKAINWFSTQVQFTGFCDVSYIFLRCIFEQAIVLLLCVKSIVLLRLLMLCLNVVTKIGNDHKRAQTITNHQQKTTNHQKIP